MHFFLPALISIGILASNVLADPPRYCQPPDRVDAANNYRYKDMSDVCKETGNCANACVIIIQSATCGTDWTSESVGDLQIAIINQATKDGQFQSTTQGQWTATFDFFTTALPNRKIASNEWFWGLQYQWPGSNSGVKTPQTIYFTMVNDRGQQFVVRGSARC